MAARQRALTPKSLKQGLKRQQQADESISIAHLLKMKSPGNPRTIEPDAMEVLRKSLRDKGVAEPICVNVRTANIVGGHQRVNAAKLEGWDSFPVWYVDMSLVDEMELNVLLNNPESQGRYDDLALQAFFKRIQEEGGDLFGTGFNLQQQTLILEGWDSDFEKIESQTPHTDGIVATIFVEVPQADKERVKEWLQEKLGELELDGLRVR